MGYSVLFHAALQTAKISLPTVIEARRGVLRQDVCDERLRSWAGKLLDHVGVELVVMGLEHLQRHDGPFVVVSNHRSHYDIPVLYSSLPLSLRMAAKAELFETPLWGPALRASGFVVIDRKNPERAHESLRKAGEQMRKTGTSLYVAPEGTRSSDGELGRFKAGAFRLAQMLDVPVLPVALSGTELVHRKGSRTIGRGGRVTVRVLTPRRWQPEETPGQVAEEVRGLIAQALEEQD